MYSNDTKIFIVLLIAAAMLAMILFFFIITAIGYQKRYRHLYLQKIAAEINTLEKERKRIAADLHDDLGPLLAIMKLHAETLLTEKTDTKESPEFIYTHLEYLIQFIKNTHHALWSPVLERNGFAAAVSSLVKEINNTALLHAVFICTEHDMPLKKSQHLHLFRIVQELLANTLKHAGADHIHIVLRMSNSFIILHFRDNGSGFSKEKITEQSFGSGMYNIAGRVDLLKGELLMETAPGEGVHVEIKIPLNKSKSR